MHGTGALQQSHFPFRDIGNPSSSSRDQLRFMQRPTANIAGCASMLVTYVPSFWKPCQEHMFVFLPVKLRSIRRPSLFICAGYSCDGQQ